MRRKTHSGSGYSASWSNFPEDSEAEHIVKDARAIELPQAKYHPPTPYQFTLRIMFDLYCCLQPKVQLRINKSVRRAEEIPRSQMRGVFNPACAREAYSTPLRAIAFFTWHKEGRIFLTRRVYPTYFDFITYSYVQEGWGALGGVLLNRLHRKKVHPGSYIIEPEMRGRKHAPFLAETSRLRYQAAVVLPIFHPGASASASEDDLLGAFLFFIEDKSWCPADRPNKSLQFSVASFAGHMGSGLVEHHHALGISDLNLVRELSEAGFRKNVSKLVVDFSDLAVSEKTIDNIMSEVIEKIESLGPLRFLIVPVGRVGRTRSLYIVERGRMRRKRPQDPVRGVVNSIVDDHGLGATVVFPLPP